MQKRPDNIIQSLASDLRTAPLIVPGTTALQLRGRSLLQRDVPPSGSDRTLDCCTQARDLGTYKNALHRHRPVPAVCKRLERERERARARERARENARVRTRKTESEKGKEEDRDKE